MVSSSEPETSLRIRGSPPTPGQVLRLFLAEGLVSGLAGGALGLILGVGLAGHPAPSGSDFEGGMKGKGGGGSSRLLLVAATSLFIS